MNKHYGFGLSLAILLTATLAAAPHSAGSYVKRQPNIVFILADDADLKSYRFMPKTKALLEDHGAVFENYFVTASLCCPSRTSILRGQYPHNTKVQGNVPHKGDTRSFAPWVIYAPMWRPG